MWETKYALVIPKNLGLGLNSRPCSESYFLSRCPQSVDLVNFRRRKITLKVKILLFSTFNAKTTRRPEIFTFNSTFSLTLFLGFYFWKTQDIRKNSKILLTTILLLLSFFFATYNYSLTRGRMGGCRVPWTTGSEPFQSPVVSMQIFCINKIFTNHQSLYDATSTESDRSMESKF